jgi:hypothetical protein
MRRRRQLTDGERKLAKHVFKDSLNLDNVRVIEHFMSAGNLDDTAITPFGSIYFHSSDYRDDFIGSDMYKPPKPGEAHWFLHELAHVWQHYVGTKVTLRGMVLHAKAKKLQKKNPGYDPYDYAGTPVMADLLDYNLEQQGDIVADYFAWKLQWKTTHGLQLGAKDYEKILKNFLADPTYPRRRRPIWNIRAVLRGLER